MHTGLLGLIGAYAKGAPVRVISAAITGLPELFWYAHSASGIKSLKDAAGKSVDYSAAGSSIHLLILSLLEHEHVNARPTATGAIPSGEYRGEQQRTGVFENVQPNTAGRLIAKAVEHVDRSADRIERAVNSSLQRLSRGSQGDAPICAVEQAHAQPGLKALQRVAQGRGADPNFQSGPPKITVPSKSQKVAEVGEIGLIVRHVCRLVPTGR